ncbi:PREDICTED: post-GPI attachment to proteins factor 3 [Dinoponera quadriceps]|uniref:Post-GPI attachment to proteins factor 3 n=1 Tax=Dinoponera quadriceps TaxID=609295 RepID=A0A6P3Y4R9_DINQU|nr:PREDICTED: post-GPI attachment to proteins factor 3 [Dinoponera quadriceps]
MSKPVWVLLLAIQCCLVADAVGSIGDKSQIYNQCLALCRNSNCKDEIVFKVPPSLWLTLLNWSCKEDCSYICTWRTVDSFISHGLKVPQFHGKWPFIRMFGCQEPASVLFSMLNFYAHWKMFRKFKKRVGNTNPMFYAWSYFSIICLNGWFWSAIFHSRDRPFTEAMDYSCAFSMVLTLLYCMLLRITYRNNKVFIMITCGYVSILCMHLSHLWSGKINYGYNMTLNILIGLATFTVTMLWWYVNRAKLFYAYLIAWFNILTVFVTLLELADFPPIFWVLDAHSLWHASTVPLTLLLYRFMISDCSHLQHIIINHS